VEVDPTPPPEPAEPVAAPRWGLGDAAAGWFLGVLCTGLVAAIWAEASGGTELSIAGLAVAEVGLWVGLAGAPVLASRRKGSGSLAVDFGLRAERPDAATGIAIGVGCQLILVPLIYLPLQWLFGKQDVSKPAKEVIGGAHGAGAIALLAVVLVIGAPIVEELFFRGLVLRAIQRRFGSSRYADTYAVVGSAVIFGLSHFEGIQLPALIAFGVILGVLAVRNGRLGPGIWAHAAFNAVTVIILAR
jgi:membrane protease YdiL (CAAX protease family)